LKFLSGYAAPQGSAAVLKIEPSTSPSAAPPNPAASQNSQGTTSVPASSQGSPILAALEPVHVEVVITKPPDDAPIVQYYNNGYCNQGYNKGYYNQGYNNGYYNQGYNNGYYNNYPFNAYNNNRYFNNYPRYFRRR
jgi:rhodanese-related sulfurtransferase